MNEEQTGTKEEQTGNTNESSTESTGQTASTAPANAADGSQVSKLMHLADHHCDLFHTPTNEPFASCMVKGHTENHAVRSPEFKNWLMHRMFVASGRIPTSHALESALSLLCGKACFAGPKHEVHVRLAQHDDDLIVDLGDAEWQVVRVSRTNGYEVLKQSPVKFRRPKGAQPLPVPQPGGSFDDLRKFVNLGDENQWKLFAGFLVGAFHP